MTMRYNHSSPHFSTFKKKSWRGVLSSIDTDSKFRGVLPLAKIYKIENNVAPTVTHTHKSQRIYKIIALLESIRELR